MAINVYTGLMGSGKSYEVVSEVIVPAIAQGRRVVTNVDGISDALVREYVALTYMVEPENLGRVVHVTNGDVSLPNFFPYYDDGKEAHIDTIVQPGDLVCIDEAWRFWPASGVKISPQHKSFFLEHRHFTNPKTNIACDLVLMIQDMGTLNRFVKNVVAFNARTHKKVSLGMPNTYSVTLFEGYKQSASAKISNSIRKYKKEIFPLYSSFKGGAGGKSVSVDKRQNIFNSKFLLMLIAVIVVGGMIALYMAIRFFNPKSHAVKGNQPVQSIATKTAQVAGAAVVPSQAKPLSAFSETWRIVGEVNFNNSRYVLIADAHGRLRYESPSMFLQSGPQLIGDIDGSKVTYYSGVVSVAASAPPKEGKK